MDVQFILISKRLYKKLTAWPLWAVCVNCVWFLQDISVKTDIHIILLWPHIISWLPNIYQQTQNLQTWQLNLKGGKGNIQFKDHQKQSLMITHILVHYSVPWFKLIDWFCQTKGRMEVMKTSGIKMSGWDNIYITKPHKASSITSTIWPTVAKTVLRHDTLITEKHPNKHLHLSKIWGWRHPSNETLNVCLNLDKSVFGCWHNQRWVRLTDVTIISNHVRHHLYHQSCFHILSGCLINNCYFSNRWSSDLVGLDLGLRMVTWAWKRFFTRKETWCHKTLKFLLWPKYWPCLALTWSILVTWPVGLMFWHWPVKVTPCPVKTTQLDLGHPGEICWKIATLRLLSTIIKNKSGEFLGHFVQARFCVKHHHTVLTLDKWLVSLGSVPNKLIFLCFQLSINVQLQLFVGGEDDF